MIANGGAKKSVTTKRTDDEEEDSSEDDSSLSRSETSSSSSSSSSNNSNNSRVLIETTLVKTLTDQVKDLPRKTGAEMPEIRRQNAAKILKQNFSTSSSATSSATRRYKFGLTNHFLTMPDVNQEQTAKFYESHELIKQFKRIDLQDEPKEALSAKRLEMFENNLINGNQIGNSNMRTTGQADEEPNEPNDTDDDCDLSVMGPSSNGSDLSSMLSQDDDRHWLDSSRSGGGGGDDDKHHITTSGEHQHRQTGRLMSAARQDAKSREAIHLTAAGDAGLDAGKCISKAADENCFIASGSTYLNHPIGANKLTGALSSGVSQVLSHQHLYDPTNCLHVNQHSKSPIKEQKISTSTSDECASNSLLVRFSSIMYATFLVILGCILHVSELRQKSKNSSDHIYTIIVASLGIFWLIFLQLDLQRYKRYASKYILLESIFNDRQRAAHSQSPSVGNLMLDPTSRSTTSSSASLVNDRMSMNTEVIFKKTAYKMYQQRTAAFKPSLGLEAKNNGTTNQQHEDSGSTSGQSSTSCDSTPLVPAYKFLHGKMGANFYLKCGMAAFCFGHVIHEGLRFGQQVYFFATANLHCRDSAAMIAHLVTPLYSFYQLFMMFKYSNLVINRHKILAKFGLMHIIGTCVTFWIRTILEEAFEDFVHKMDYFKAQNKPINHYLDPTTSFRDNILQQTGSMAVATVTESPMRDWLNSLTSSGATSNPIGFQSAPKLFQSAISNLTTNHRNQQPFGVQNVSLAQSAFFSLMSSPISATISPQLVRHIPDSYHCAQNTLLTTKSMNALPYLYPFTIEYNLLIAATFLSLYFNIGKISSTTSSQARVCLPSDCYKSNEKVFHQDASRTASKVYQSPLQQQIVSKQPSLSGLSYSNNNVTSSSHFGAELSDNNSTSFGQQRYSISDIAPTSASYYLSRYSQHGNSLTKRHHGYGHGSHDHFGEYKSNFVVNADCHAANKGLFLGFFVLLVTLVTIVIFFVTINKPSHIQLGIKINLIQEATLTSLILIVTLVGYRQIMRLNRNPFIRDKVTTDDVLMLIPLPFFFIHSLLSFRAETATLYAPSHLTKMLIHNNQTLQRQEQNFHDLASQATASRLLKLNESLSRLNEQQALAEQRNGQNPSQARPMISAGSELQTPILTSRNNSRSPTNHVNTNSNSNAAPNTQQQQPIINTKIDHYKLLTIALNLAVMLEVIIQTNFIIDGLRRCSESRYLRFKKPGRELITFAILLNITYWIVATFETKSVEQYKTEIEYYGPLPYMFISHTTLPVMLFYRYHSSVCLAEIWNRAYKSPKRR